MNFKPLSPGLRIGSWTILGPGLKHRHYKCVCQCLTEHEVYHYNLTGGKSLACRKCGTKPGLDIIHRTNIKHGETVGTKNKDTSKRRKESPEYNSWASMLARCNNPNNSNYKNYGGRGITVCQEWTDSFPAFLLDVGKKPSKDHSLGRIDNEKGYLPGNVRWETQEQQRCNTRANTLIEFKGEKKTLAEWSRQTGLKEGTIRARLGSGWSIEETLTHPCGETRLKPRKISKQNRLIEFEGKTQTITEWGKETELGDTLIRARLKAGWSVKNALSTPKRQKPS